MRLRRIGLTALITVLTTLVSVDLGFPVLGQLIQNPQSKIQNQLVLAQTPTDRKAEADRLRQQGIEQYGISQFEAALQSWQQALIIYREIKDRQGEGKALMNLGAAYNSLGDYAKAIEYYQQALAIAREIQNRQGEAAALSNLGVAYNILGDYGKAIEYCQQSLTIAREIKDRQGEAAALSNLGLAYDGLGDYVKAIEYHQQHLAIAREIQNRQGEGNALSNLGGAYQSLGDYAKAIEYQQQRLAIAQRIKDRLGEAAGLSNLGVAYNSLGDYGKAIEYHQQHLAIARAIKDRLGEGNALGNLGIAYSNLGDYAKAIDYHQQSLTIARAIKNRYGEGQSLGNLGLAYDGLGDYPRAIEYHQQSLAIARAIKDRKGEGQSLGNLGIAYGSLGDYSKAIEYHQQNLAIARAIKDRNGEGKALGNLGGAYESLGDYAKAIEYQQQSLAIARAIKDRQGEGNALSNLGNAYNSLGDYARAIEYYEQRLAIAKSIKDLYGEGNGLNNLGLALLKSGNLTQAEKILRAGIDAWESQRRILGDNDAYKVSIFEVQARTYRILQKVLIAQNQPLAALEIAERGRARAFVELLARRIATTSDSTNSALTQPSIELLQQIAKRQNATLVEYSIVGDDFKIKGKPGTYESELYIWVIKPTGEVTFRSSDLKPLWQQKDISLAELVLISRSSIGVRGLPIVAVRPRLGVLQRQEANLTQRLQQLHQILIQPIADLLPTDAQARVIFMPQESLFLVPFPALKDEQGKYLIEKHTILTSPSIQALQLTREQRERVGARHAVPLQGKDALVVGNPTMPSVRPAFDEPPQQLPPLPGAEREAKAIAPLLNTQPLIGKDATKATIKQLLPKARMIHLATHGLLDEIGGIGSAIAFTPSGDDNGLLTAEEIFSLKLNAELVVLSACDTGRGRLTGDGVVGLSRSLISAGVPSVLVSLWSVPDDSTAFLMTEFYKNLERNADKAQALRKAMLATMKQKPYSNPLQWAAFTLIGEAE